jgi:amino acid adenylation domain-containing protein
MEEGAGMSSTELMNAVKCKTLVDLLRLRVEEQSTALAYRFLLSGDSDGPVEEWSYRDLSMRAWSIAACLQAAQAEGERALLLYPPSLEFIAAFLGCASAGVAAVPSYPHRDLSRLEAIVQDCGARFILTTTSFLMLATGFKQQAPGLNKAQWIATDGPLERTAADWRSPEIDGETLAFLQYTSGSTGHPKGVMVSHANLLHNEHLITEAFGTDPSTHVVGWLPLYHDMGLIGNVLQPLYLGASCTLMSPLAFLQRPLRWLEAISHFHGQVSGGPNFAYDLCVSKNKPPQQFELDHWKVAFNGAEPVRKETLDRFARSFASSGFRREAFHPCYGLAEATLFVTGIDRSAPLHYETIEAEALERNQAIEAQPGVAARVLVSSGRSHPEQQLLIVDPETLQPLGDRAIGEICLAGPSMAQGYWRRPDETANVFHACIPEQGEMPFLRTGDLGFTVDGELYVTGRLKDLIILRGRNLYPQDIEFTVQEAHAAVRKGSCAAFSLEVRGEEKLAVAAEVLLQPDGGSAEDAVDAIRRRVAKEHGARVHTVILLQPKSIPKTSSGKIRRSASRADFLKGKLDPILVSSVDGPAAPELGQESLEAATAAPSLALESADSAARLKAIEQFIQHQCAKHLQTETARIHLELAPASVGLDSLMGLELQAELESALGLTLSEGFLWQHGSLSDAARQLLVLWEQRRDQAVDDGTAPGENILPGSLEGELAVSSGQQRLWFLDRLIPGSALYNIHFGLRMVGNLDEGLLQYSLNVLVERHAILRTTFLDHDGLPRQIVHPKAPVEITHIDLRSVPEFQREEELRRAATVAASLPFNLTTGPLARFHLAQVSNTEHVLLVSQHHIVTDGWSITLLARDLGAIYEALARGASLPPAPLVQFADYARWELSHWSQLEADRAYWSKQLDSWSRLDLPADRPRPRRLSFAGGRRLFHLPKDVSESLVALGTEQGCTPFVTLLAGYCLWMYRHTRQEEFNIGSFTANRGRAELREMIGFLANTIVLRCDLSGDPDFRQLLGRVRRAVAEAMDHARLPFAEIVQSAANVREGDDNPLFQASFILENNPVHAMEIAGMKWEPLSWVPDGAVEGTAKFDLALAMQETANGFLGSLEYSSDLFDASTIGQFIARMQVLFQSMVAHPDASISDVPLLTDAEREQLIVGWNATHANVPLQTCFQQMFEEQVAKTPERVAASHAGKKITYGELNRRANRLAHYLRRNGVGPEVVVALLMNRGIDMLISILAVFKAGGAYLPLDPNHPPLRWLQILEQGEVGHAIGSRELGRELESQAQASGQRALKMFAIKDLSGLHEGDGNPAPLSVPANLAYVIFTSGSTGKPKGAMVEHLGMLNHLHAKIRDLDLGSQDMVAQTASQCFDISVWQFLAALIVGGQVSIVSNEVAAVPEKLFAHTASEKITVLELVPSMLRALLDEIEGGHLHAADLSQLRWLLLTGEALPPELVVRWREYYPAVPLLNAYGPTECSDDVTHHAITTTPTQPVAYTPIGRPIINVRLYVLDGRMEPVPAGVPGELYVGGICVGRGYLKDPLRTAEIFVPDAFSTGETSRLYRTGDLVRLLPSGEIVFLGRTDHQIKVRGFRIELGEIEAVLQGHPSVRQNVAAVYQDENRNQQLVAYITLRVPGITIDELKSWLKQRLPEYMVPSILVMMDALPLLANGKIDRKALPAPELGAGSEGYVPPRNSVEETLVRIWREVLGIERVGVNDDFFALGGHSLRATQVVARIRDNFAVEIPLRQLFEATTVAQLALVIGPQEEGAKTNEPELGPPIARVERTAVVLPMTK